MKKAIIAIVAVLVLTGVGLTLFFLLRGGDEESQTDVIVTVNGGTELNLTGDVGEVIRKVNESNGYVLEDHKYSVLDYDKKTNNIYVPRDHSLKKIKDTKDYWIGIHAYKFSFLRDKPSCSGQMTFIFTTKKEDDEKLSVDRITLLDGWKGNISDIDEYLNEKYSITYQGLGRGFRRFDKERVALFRDGKLVPVDEITDEYGKEAERIIFDYKLDMEQYYQDNKNIDIDKAWEYVWGPVGYFLLTRDDHSTSNSLSNLITNTFDVDYPDVYPAVYKEICMQLAMNDWAAKDDGCIQNYGCINWPLQAGHAGKERLLVSVPCTHEDFLRIDQPYRVNEDGEWIPPKYLQ